MRKYFLYILYFLFGNAAFSQNIPNAGTLPVVTGVKQLPPVFTATPTNYLRTFSPQIPIQDTLQINMTAPVENVQTAIEYADSYGRTIESVAKQLSPNKKDNVSVGNYDEFGRGGTLSYMPYASLTNDGGFKQNAFAEDSAFYKSLYPLEQVIYSQTQYDGSPMNITVKGLSPGNEWGGANRGKTLAHRSSTAADSVRYWSIDILTEDDLPSTTGYYLPATLNVKEITDERGIKSISYTDLAGRTILTKTQEANSSGTGHYGWLCTYYVYDEMGSLRIVIPPKAVQQLAVSSWQCTTVIMQGLCYSYFYDNRGRQITKSIPDKGKSYVAYDLSDRPVMTQDPNLRQTNQWAFVLYDAQSRPVKSGIIYSNLTKDIIQYQAANSNSYPTLTGTYTVMTETYYDNYDWVAATGAPVTASVNNSNINSSNFITGYNSAPDYAQPLTQSLRIRGAVTGTKMIVLGTSDYNYAVTMYDNYGRAIQTQQRNHTGGTDIATMQYSYKGTVLRSHLAHSKGGSNAQSHSMLTKYSYDHVGRLLSTTKNIDNLGDKTITQLAYEETGQVKTKTLGGGLQVQNYSYNIQGMLTAINAPYVTANTSTGNEYFGEILSYAHGFTTNQYNGGIAGVQWKNAGDGIARAYGYSYDNVGRLSKADFTQQNSGSTAWTNDKVDYSVKGLSYDAGGNIMSMTQRGLLGVGGNATIDSLAYSYFANSNRLQKVTDAATGGGGLGDFKDSTNTNDDYAYDVNGNIVADNNRHLHNANGSIGTVFNLLDKPDSMAVAGRSCTYYKYDAAGTLLTKMVKDYKNNSIKNYSYAAGFVYVNDTLQYAMMEEGRIRIPVSTEQFSQVTAIYDYFIKDHAGNIRTVLTDEKRRDDYPMATMETANATAQAIEEAVYAGLPETRTNKNTIAGYPTDPTTSPNDFVAKVQATAGSQKVGPSLTLKVMTGDTINIRVNSWYKLNNVTPAAPQSPLTNIVTSLISGISGSAVVNTHGVTSSQFNTAGSFTPDVTSFLNNQTNNTTGGKPKAFINWIFFDEQFNIVQSASGFEQVGNDTEFKLHVKQPVATKCGFLYVYVSNETPNIPVYFDNLQVSHVRSPLLETSEYYPYGLKMANISYKASMTITNRHGFNGGNEYEDEGELNYSTTFYRKYDAQIGRFTGVDMLAEEFVNFSPYNFGLGNPVMFNDPSGALNSVNPASFTTAASLINYILANGISSFDHEFNKWTFDDGGGGGGASSYSWGDNFTLGQNKNGESVVTFSWFKTYNDGEKGKFGEFSTLGSVALGTTSIKVQNIWSKAMSWGETHRDATYQWYNGTEHYDAMWSHNYDGFLKRKNSGQALSQKGDRGSYTESLAGMQAQYAREQDARNFEMGFVGVLAAPFAAYGLAEAGVVGLVSNGYTAVNTYLTNASIQSAIAINTAKNVAVDAIGGAIVQYGPSSMAFSGGLYGLVQQGYGYTVTGSTISSVGVFLGGPIGIGIFPSGTPGLLTGNSIFKK